MNLENQAAVTPDEDFAAAFAKFSKAEDAPVMGGDTPTGGGGDSAEPVIVEEPAAVVVDSTAEPVVVAESAEDTSTPAAVESGTDAPAGSEPVADAVATPVDTAAEPVKAPSADDILSRLDEIVSKTATPAPAAVEQPKAETVAEPALYTDDEQKFLTDYEKDWSDVSKGEALRRRAENAALVEFIFTEIAKTVIPLKEMTMTMATRTHATDLEQKIGKYDDSLRDQVETWIGTQPDYLQVTYKQVIDEGTSDQVADLIGRFRKETGSATPISQPTEAKGGTELSTPAKQAVEALAPVDTKRTVIEQQDDPNDFKAAFVKFSKVLDS